MQQIIIKKRDGGKLSQEELAYAYKAGWQVNTAAIVQSAFLAVALIFVGLLIYHEPLSWNKLAGVGICIIGLVFINLK